MDTPDHKSVELAAHKSVELAALQLLQRREHSVQELKRKLLRAGHPSAAVDAVIDQLVTRRLISDIRFAGSRLRYRSNRGQGPVRIRAELRREGVAEDLIQAEIGAADRDWGRLAISVRVRKFGIAVPRGSAERAKQARFLQYRGFTADQIREALGPSADADGSGMDADFRSDPDPDF
jgi:regulatory protein